MFKVSNKDARTTPMVSLLLLWTHFTPCSSLSILNFEQVNPGWVVILWNHFKPIFFFLPPKSIKNFWFSVFSGVIKRQHWPEIGQCLLVFCICFGIIIKKTVEKYKKQWLEGSIKKVFRKPSQNYRKTPVLKSLF